jgi:hypothetical protein
MPVSMLGRGSVDARAVGLLIELHEDEVPDLDEAVAVLIGRSGRAARRYGAMIVEDFRAGAAGAGVAHRPEIVRGRDADDALLRQPGNLAPQAERLVVGVIDGDGQPVRRDAPFARDQRPRMMDRLLLEIIAEAEIAQHLEEGVVPGGIADIVEIIVLAARAHAFLRGCRRLVGARFPAR